MAIYYTTLTVVGAARLTNAQATGTPLLITQVAVGDGNGAPVVVSEGRTTLVREVYRGPINSLVQDAVNLNWLIAELVIPADQGGWTLREVGLFDSAGVLIAYGNLADSYKPTLAEGSAKELMIRMYLETSAASSVVLKIDPAVVLATRAWVVTQTKLATRLSRPGLYFMAQF